MWSLLTMMNSFFNNLFTINLSLSILPIICQFISVVKYAPTPDVLCKQTDANVNKNSILFVFQWSSRPSIAISRHYWNEGSKPKGPILPYYPYSSLSIHTESKTRLFTFISCLFTILLLQKLWFQHTWPLLEEEVRSQEVLAAALEPVLFLIAECSPEEYNTKILPALK